MGKGLTRRKMLLSGLAAGGAAFLGNAFCASRFLQAREVAPAGSLLKKKTRGTTINAHAHLPDSGWLKRPPARYDPKDITANAIVAYAKKRGIDLSPEDAELARERAVRYNEASTLEDHARIFLAEMDEAGLDLTVLLMIDHAFQPGDFGRQYKVPYEKVLEDVAAMRQRHPGRFITFAGVDPSRGKEGVKLFESAIKDYGFAGMGEWVTQQWEVFPNDRELCYPYYEKCVELGVPFLNNCEGRFEHCAPGVFEQVAKDFPQLKICLGGAGRPRPDEERRGIAQTSFPDDALALAERYENVYIDMDDWQRRDEEGIRKYLQHVRRALDCDARTRVMFGSDYPVFVMLYSEKEWIEVTVERAEQYGVTFSDEELELYFSKNATDYLGLGASSA